MKALEDTKQLIHRELSQCKSHDDVHRLFQEAQRTLQASSAPYGQKRHMWEEVKTNLPTLTRRPEIIDDAAALLDGILKKQI